MVIRNLMKKIISAGVLSVVAVLSTSCGGRLGTGEDIGPGKAGLLMELYGDKRGIKNAQLQEGGRIPVAWGQDLLVFPVTYYTATFTQDPTEGSPKDQRIRFSASGGSSVGLDTSVAFSWSIEQMPDRPKGYTKLHEFVAKYNQEPEVFINKTLFAATRDCATKSAAEKGLGAAALRANVQPLLEGMQLCLQAKFPELVISNVGSLTTVEVPEAIRDIIDAQFSAQQGAITAEANAQRAKADGKALLEEATAKANAAIEEARGKAEADRLRSASMTPQVLEMERLRVQSQEIEKWNGVRPATVIQSGSVQVPR
jgi:hypothetical protein